MARTAAPVTPDATATMRSMAAFPGDHLGVNMLQIWRGTYAFAGYLKNCAVYTGNTLTAIISTLMDSVTRQYMTRQHKMESDDAIESTRREGSRACCRVQR